MSRIGRKPIYILDEVNIKKIDDFNYEIKGPKGLLYFTLPQDFILNFENNALFIQPAQKLSKKRKAMYGTLRSILNNKIIGVTQGFEKILILEGLGYSAEIKDKKIIFKLGFSHIIEIEIPEDISVEVKPEKGKSLIYIRGIDKEKVGLFASKIKKLKPADRYHAKGFRYINEVIKLKPVKKSAK